MDMLDGGGERNSVTEQSRMSHDSKNAEAQRSEERLADAQRKANEVQLKLEKERRKSRELEEKARRRESRKEFILAFLTPKQIVWMVIALFLLAFLFFAVVKPMVFDSAPEIEYLSESQLERVVCVDKLSTAEYVYNGIAEITNDNGDVVQRIKYDATVRAGIKMTDIRFEIDNENMTVTPVLPEIEIQDPEIETSSFDYMPRNPSMELDEIISACKNDARKEIENQGQIYITAEDNLKSAIEALILPLIEGYGYTIQWESDEADGLQETEPADQNTGNDAAPTEEDSVAESEGSNEQLA